MHVVNAQHIDQMHIVNVLRCILLICKIAPICSFTMCIVACVQCDSEFRMGVACYECAIYRSNAYCGYATLLVVNIQIITEMHVHNVHCGMLHNRQAKIRQFQYLYNFIIGISPIIEHIQNVQNIRWCILWMCNTLTKCTLWMCNVACCEYAK